MKTFFYKAVLLGNHKVGKTTLFKKLKGEVEEESNSKTSSCRVSDSLNLDPCTLEFRLKEKPVRIMVSTACMVPVRILVN